MAKRAIVATLGLGASRCMRVQRTSIKVNEYCLHAASHNVRLFCLGVGHQVKLDKHPVSNTLTTKCLSRGSIISEKFRSPRICSEQIGDIPTEILDKEQNYDHKAFSFTSRIT
jgi:hypothetical protein